MKQFEFVVTTPPNEEAIVNFHNSLAQGFINKYGIEFIKKVLEEVKLEKQ